MAGNSRLFNVNLLSFNENIFISNVVSISSINSIGEFVILSDHEPFLTDITSFVVCFNLANNETRKFFTSSGFIEVNHKGCFVVAEECYEITELSISSIYKDRRKVVELSADFINDYFFEDIVKELSCINRLMKL